MYTFIVLWLERSLVFLLGFVALWLIVFVFTQFEQRLPLFLALFLTYIISAYFVLPRTFFFVLALLRKGKIPGRTRSVDGFPADPVNIILVGSQKDLEWAFQKIGWHKADPLTFKTAWRMIGAFLFHRAYPQAPFSALYLFGRRQDIGFEECLEGSPRKRNHIRFWLADVDSLQKFSDIEFWASGKIPCASSRESVWIGSGIKDLGFGFTRFTYQFSHRVDRNIDKQRTYIINALRKRKCIKKEKFLEASTTIKNKYVTDGRVFYAHIISSENEKNNK